MIHFLKIFENCSNYSSVEILFNLKKRIFWKKIGPFNLTILIGFYDARKRWNWLKNKQWSWRALSKINTDLVFRFTTSRFMSQNSGHLKTDHHYTTYGNALSLRQKKLVNRNRIYVWSKGRYFNVVVTRPSRYYG